MVRFLGLFLAMANTGSCMAGNGAPGTTQTGASMPPAPAACTVVASATIGPKGGSFAAPPGPLAGLRVSVPADAVDAAMRFELASCTARITVRSGHGSNRFVRLTAGTLESFSAPVRIHVRYPPREGLPVPYRVDDDNSLDLAQMLELDRANGTFDIWTFRPGLYTWIYD